MEIKNNLGKKINSQILIKSLTWNCVIQVFKNEKNLDITPYLKGIDIKGKVITIKTQSPLINSEIQMIENKLTEEIKKKLAITGVSFPDFEIRYL